MTCKHKNLEFKLEHVHMDDCNVGAVKLAARCRDCQVKMALGRGLMVGASSMMATADGLDGDILIPCMGLGETPDKEWGFTLRLHEVPGEHGTPQSSPEGSSEAGAPAAQPHERKDYHA